MFYWFALWIVRLVFLLYFRFTVSGRENIPQSGGAVIAANHASYLDPPAVGISMPRKLNFMAKAELFQIPILGPIIKALGAFPVRRASGDKTALVNALKLLADGQLMGIFPQGRRASNQELALRGGAVFLALKAQVPLIPVAVLGSDRAWGMDRKFPRPTKIRVVIGKPIIVPPLDPKRRQKQMAEINSELSAALKQLLAEDSSGERR
jgi:1-acyl-sn-glycerol-3-phosphate acyltransferase